jgi:hypothetical protein
LIGYWLLNNPATNISSLFRMRTSSAVYKLKVTIIDHNPKWDDKSRQERESFWIRKLETLSPNGINEKK